MVQPQVLLLGKPRQPGARRVLQARPGIVLDSCAAWGRASGLCDTVCNICLAACKPGHHLLQTYRTPFKRGSHGYSRQQGVAYQATAAQLRPNDFNWRYRHKVS